VRKNKSGFAPILIVILIVAVAIGGYLLWTQNRLSFPQPTPLPAPTLNPTADWKTYTNTNFNYSVKYPPYFNIRSLFPDRYPDVSISPIIDIYSNENLKTVTIESDSTKDDSLGLEDYVSGVISQLNAANKDSAPLKIIGETTLDGRPMVNVSNNLDYSKELRLYAYIERDPSHLIVIRLGPVFAHAENEYKYFFYQVLTTFKFIEPSPTPTCKPRPACLDQEPRCLIPETSDMCPKASPNSSY